MEVHAQNHWEHVIQEEVVSKGVKPSGVVEKDLANWAFALVITLVGRSPVLQAHLKGNARVALEFAIISVTMHVAIVNVLHDSIRA
ncbi:hypothetical protein L195_g034004 [Trifolium pratense]|uniref:Uncharacterized protein n=1 Tax=Trifolium pratense TaxID=57577 RepID=A0A2K3LHM1_TRIPR|nr:hypothetical protein L195_g034004 [Trifolium pratense]